MRTAPTLDLTMAELIAAWPSARPVLARHGMACVGCGMAKFETVAEATAAYGVDPARFLREVSGLYDGQRGRPRSPAARRRAALPRPR